MFKLLLVSVAALLACQGSVIPEEALDVKNARSFNSYYYFDRDKPLVAEPITHKSSDDLITDTTFKPELKTVIVIHGHGGTAFTTLNPLMKESLFRNVEKEELNVIVMDWSVFAGQSYVNAVAAVPQIGRYLAEYITEVLDDLDDFSLSNLHLVGFGLGAHVAGVAGRRLSGQVRRITALDPSGNLWGANTERLTRHDAAYVEVIHTDGLGTLSNGIGEPLGHVDFFANGAAVFQPGCFNNECSHNRAYELFAASLTSGGLWGHSCSTMQQVALNTCTGTRLELGKLDLVKHGSGIYRVNTGRIYPYTI